MNLPLDHETATADLLTDILAPSLRAPRVVSDADLFALIQLLDQELAGRSGPICRWPRGRR